MLLITLKSLAGANSGGTIRNYTCRPETCLTVHALFNTALRSRPKEVSGQSLKMKEAELEKEKMMMMVMMMKMQ